MIGKKLAHYEVTALLGKGGMGEVYRARDPRLDREVALKVLPREMSQDPERIARFEREARTLATLQHPNVASVYGFEDTPEARFLVMELVEGEDLSERLARGALPVDEAVDIARQIAEGLEAAHERNIVHRDLKPANVKIDPAGQVKILDFGLARAYVGDAEGQEDLANSPTITAAMTQAGTILGTAAYMSPEQAKGKAVDKRADIWAFGAILFEMLTGRRLFEAETVSETLAGVLLTNVDLEALPADTPPALRALIERCLQKDSRLRLRDIGEARIALTDPTSTAAMRAVTGVGRPAPGRPVWPGAVAVALALAVGLFAGRQLVHPQAPETLPDLLFDIPDPTGSIVPGSLALAPDGSALIFARQDSLGNQSLWKRPLDSQEIRPLPGTEGGRQPFWAPDGRHFGYFVGDQVMRADADGGNSSPIGTVVQTPMGGAWNQFDEILVGSNEGPIHLLSASGGRMEAVTEVADIEDTHCWPQFLPDGRHYLFLSDASSDEGHRLHVRSLDDDEDTILRTAVRSQIYVDPAGALLWSDGGQLFAHPFDIRRRQLTGPPLLVQNELIPFGERHECALTFSQNGMLAYQQASDQSSIVRLAVDGSASKALLANARYRNPRLSPDGRLLAVEVQENSEERLIWVYDLARGTQTLISERGAMSDSPVWTPDGEFVYFGSSVGGDWQAYRKRVYGGSPPEPMGIPAEGDDIAVLDCSADGGWLLVSVNTRTKSMDLYLGAIGDEGITWQPWLTSPATEQFARFSPDARWITYSTDASGQLEIYVAPREGGADLRRWLISVNGGTDAAWSRDASKLFYRNPAGMLMEVAVSATDDEISFGAPEPRILVRPSRVGYLRNAYDPALDAGEIIGFIDTGTTVPAVRVRTGWRQW